jgi:putative aminopeptidase FrvX
LWEIKQENLIIRKNNKLGSGAFADVFVAKLIGNSGIKRVCKNSGAVAHFHNCEVAAKVLPSFANEAANAEFQKVSFLVLLITVNSRYMHSHRDQKNRCL